MKNRILLLSTILLVVSCNSGKENEQNIQTINPKDIRISKVVHDSLTVEQIDKIKKIHSTFAELSPVSLEETIINFKRDQDPDSEIAIWLQMVRAYEKYISNLEGKLDLNTKKEVYSLILLRSMMSEKEAIASSKLVFLTEKEAKEVLSYYTAIPDPIEVVKTR
jgi:type III secretory pathway component EscV